MVAMLDGLPTLADMLGERPRPARFEERFASLLAFMHGTLLPHMEVVEETLHPELDRLMQNRHSMAQMRREHGDIRALPTRLDTFGQAVEADALGPAGTVGLRRVLYRLHAMIKVHLAEDEEYQRLLERTLSEEEQAQLVRGLEHTVTDPLSLAPDHGAG